MDHGEYERSEDSCIYHNGVREEADSEKQWNRYDVEGK